MSRREQDGIVAEASSIDRHDERLEKDEMRTSDEWSRCVCMGLTLLLHEIVEADLESTKLVLDSHQLFL